MARVSLESPQTQQLTYMLTIWYPKTIRVLFPAKKSGEVTLWSFHFLLQILSHIYVMCNVVFYIHEL